MPRWESLLICYADHRIVSSSQVDVLTVMHVAQLLPTDVHKI